MFQGEVRGELPTIGWQQPFPTIGRPCWHCAYEYMAEGRQPMGEVTARNVIRAIRTAPIAWSNLGPVGNSLG